MNDLLGDGLGGDGGRGGKRSKQQAVESGDIEMGFAPPPTDQQLAMQQFFTAVEEIKKDMAEIKGLQKDLDQMHERSKTIVKSKEMQRHREEMQVGVRSVVHGGQLARMQPRQLQCCCREAKEEAHGALGQRQEGARHRPESTHPVAHVPVLGLWRSKRRAGWLLAALGRGASERQGSPTLSTWNDVHLCASCRSG